MDRRKLSLLAIPLTVFTLARPSVGDDPVRTDPPKPAVPEFAQMLGAILVHGSDMSPNSGWFHPSESRYGWSWLLGRFDADKNDVLTADEFEGSARWFRTLDRDGDGVVTSEDLDWSPRSRYLQGRAQARGRFARMDSNGNVRMTLEKWEKAFEQAAKGKTFLTQDDIANLLYPPPAPSTPPKGGDAKAPEGPSRLTRDHGRKARNSLTCALPSRKRSGSCVFSAWMSQQSAISPRVGFEQTGTPVRAFP